MNWNPEQSLIFSSPSRIFRVFGGPGTGKTELAAHKALSLLQTPQHKGEILILCRTQSDIDNMTRKLFQLIGNHPIKTTTFRAFAYKTCPNAPNLISDFQLKILLSILLKKYPFGSVFRRIGESAQLTEELSDLLNLLRHNLISPDALPEIADDPLLAELKIFYRRVEDEIVRMGFISEPGLLQKATREIAPNFSAVIVEEVQDITLAQYEFLKAICRNCPQVMFFGDPYRNIHRFEGADPDLLRHQLERDFPQLETIYLKHSYRLGTERLLLAQKIFDREAEPFLPFSCDKSDDLYYTEFNSPAEEASAVAGTIEELVRRQNFTLEDIAIILRSPGVEGSRFRRALLLKDIPVKGGYLPYFPPAVTEFFKEITGADFQLNQIDETICKIANKYQEDEISLWGLAQTSKLLGEAFSVLGDENIYQVCEYVKEELKSLIFQQDTGGVTITSVHSARGKSFKIAFMPGLVENSFPSEVKQLFIFGFRQLEKLRSYLPLAYIERADLEKHLNEERRLFYCAMSIPSERLYFSRPLMKQGEPLNPSLFIYETGAISPNAETFFKSWGKTDFTLLPIEGKVEAEIIHSLKILSPSQQQESLSEIEKQLSGKIDLNFVRQALETKRTPLSFSIDHLSANAINTYLDCPRRFYYEYVLGIKPSPTPAMLTGILLHEALQELHKEKGYLNADQGKTKLKEILDEVFCNEPNIEPGSADEIVLRRYIQEKLLRYLDLPEIHQGEVVELERDFDWKLEAGICIKGRIDRIDRTGNGYELIDYKIRGNKKHQALLTRFSDLTHEDADVQLPVYFAAAEEDLKLKIENLTLLPLEFDNGDPLRITFEIIDGDTKKDKLSRATLHKIRANIIELCKEILCTTEFPRGPHTKCREPYRDKICQHIQICDLVE